MRPSTLVLDPSGAPASSRLTAAWTLESLELAMVTLAAPSSTRASATPKPRPEVPPMTRKDCEVRSWVYLRGMLAVGDEGVEVVETRGGISCDPDANGKIPTGAKLYYNHGGTSHR